MGRVRCFCLPGGCPMGRVRFCVSIRTFIVLLSGRPLLSCCFVWRYCLFWDDTMGCVFLLLFLLICVNVCSFFVVHRAGNPMGRMCVFVGLFYISGSFIFQNPLQYYRNGNNTVTLRNFLER